MPLEKDTVAVPVVRGIELRSAARLIEAPSLLQAVNTRLSGGSSKRYGHEAFRIRSGAYPASTPRPRLDRPEVEAWGEKTLDADWLLGWGHILGATRSSASTEYAQSTYPEAGYSFGLMTRDDELVSWNGHALFSHADSQVLSGDHAKIGPAVLPALRAKQVAKSNKAQVYPDAADNGSVRLVTWLDSDEAQVKYSFYDSVRGAPLLVDQEFTFVDPYNPRCFSLGNWFHILTVERDTSVLVLKSINKVDLTTVSSRSLGTCTQFYDFWKISETAAVAIVNRDGTDIVLEYIGLNGEEHSDYVSGVTVDVNAGVDVGAVGICSDPATEQLGLTFVYEQGTPNAAVIGQVSDYGGALVGTRATLESIGVDYSSQGVRLTVAPRYMKAVNGGTSAETPLFDAYWSLSDQTTGPIRRRRFSTAGNEGTATTKWHLQVVSHAFRAGDRTFVWASYTSNLQSTWFLLDEGLNPVGKLGFSVANTPGYAQAADSDVPLCSVNWVGGGAAKDQFLYHLALGYRERIATSTDVAELTGLYTEPGIQFVELDFLPRLRAAQAGRSTYIAGAQLWSYDGKELTEAGFHLAPELAGVPSQDSSGTLTQTGTYIYRADLCYRNGQNEEVRSHSLIFDSVTLTGVNDRITLEFKSALTRRDDAYILIFRNSMIDGSPTSTWYLLNSRDPASASFLRNDQTQETLQYIDDGTVSDTTILAREAHPGNSGTYLQPFPAPSCEIVAAGKDRLWVAGGELPAGQIAPSRLFSPGETPAFNANINIQVDRNQEPITALGFLGEVAVIFRYSRTYLQDGDGPDNEANGYWQSTRLGLADSGAVSQESLALVSSGLLYQSPAGIRILNAAGGLVNRSSETSATIGAPVDTLVQDFTCNGAVVVPKDQEVRWYGPDSTIVYNYLEDAWSTWTCTAQAATFNLTTNRAALVSWDGQLLLEAEDVWRDGDRTYTHLIQFPWFHAGALGDFQRIRRVLGLGTWNPDEPHSVRVEMRYDERDFPEEVWEWSVPDDDTQNTDTWGANTWGAGSWGDTSNYSMRDAVWRWRRRPHRQKCSVFSVVVSDAGTDGPGFTLAALGLELARKTGLDRAPVPTGGTHVSR